MSSKTKVPRKKTVKPSVTEEPVPVVVTDPEPVQETPTPPVDKFTEILDKLQMQL